MKQLLSHESLLELQRAGHQCRIKSAHCRKACYKGCRRALASRPVASRHVSSSGGMHGRRGRRVPRTSSALPKHQSAAETCCCAAQQPRQPWRSRPSQPASHAQRTVRCSQRSRLDENCQAVQIVRSSAPAAARRCQPHHRHWATAFLRHAYAGGRGELPASARVALHS
jgi:hypothetical protein